MAEILAIEPDALARMIEAASQPGPMSPGERSARAGLPAERPVTSPSRTVAIITLTGVLAPRGSWLLALFAGSALDVFRTSVRAAALAPNVGQILLLIDSPGGDVAGVEEAAAIVRDARRRKPVTAMVDGLAASGAYWIASQAGQMALTPSGNAGSVGVYALHTDVSQANAKAGIVRTYVASAPYKVEMNEDEPLTAAARAHLQTRVNDIHDRFTADVAQGRRVSINTVRDRFGQGRLLGAREAVQRGMADRLATFEEILEETLQAAARGLQAHATDREARERWQLKAELQRPMPR
ncbi:MAG: S49 family peptidase [Dongiaceae bacterium]